MENQKFLIHRQILARAISNCFELHKKSRRMIRFFTKVWTIREREIFLFFTFNIFKSNIFIPNQGCFHTQFTAVFFERGSGKTVFLKKLASSVLIHMCRYKVRKNKPFLLSSPTKNEHNSPRLPEKSGRPKQILVVVIDKKDLKSPPPSPHFPISLPPNNNSSRCLIKSLPTIFG